MISEPSRERAPLESAACYQVWGQMIDWCVRMALPEDPLDPTRHVPQLLEFGRSLVLENRSRDEALDRLLARPQCPRERR